MRMRVYDLGNYRSEKMHFRLVRYEFLDYPLPPQYDAAPVGPVTDEKS
jgi:hypothetical protein